MIRQFFTHVIFEKAKFSHSITHTNESSNFENSVEILAVLVSVFEQGCFLHVPQLYVSHFVVTALLTL